MSIEASDGVFTMRYSPVILFRCFKANLWFRIYLALIFKNQRSNSTKKRTAATATETATEKTIATSTSTSTPTSPGKCRSNHLIPYIWLAFLPFFCYVHFSLTFIFIVVRRLLCSFSLLLSYYTSVSWIFKTFHNITNPTASTKKKRVGTEFVILFTELYHTIF